MEFSELIEKLCNARGVSGFEDEVIAVCRDYCKDFADTEEDSMRNLYIRPRYNKGNRPLVMLDAHSDEVGFMVQAIKPDGTLRFVPLGSWNEKSLPSSRVQLYTPSGKTVTGIIAAMSPHMMTAEQRNAPPSYDNLTIDIGATSAEEAEKMGAAVGMPVVPLSDFGCNNGVMMGKAFDDRLGVAVILRILESLKNEDIAVDVIGVISSQEEVGARGTEAACNRVKADAAICFEGCPADDVSAPPYMIQDRLKGGVMIRHMDSSVICTPRFVALSAEVAAKNGIKVQYAVRRGGGNNGEYIILANGGTPTIVAGVPVRYIHTFYSVALLEDVEQNVAFGRAMVKALNRDVIKSF